MLSENSCIGDTEPAMDGREKAAAAMLSENNCMGTRPVAVMDGREKAAAAMLSGNTLMPVAWGTAGAIEINK